MKKLFYAFLLSASLSGCLFNETADSETVVLLEDIIYVSSNDIRILGRVFSLAGEASDHGFEFSTDASFANPQTVTLGEKEEVGMFFADYKLLKENTTYHYRAYVTIGNSIHYSEVGTTSTFEAGITSISDLIGEPGDQLEIVGTNFTNNLSVSFGDNIANIIDRSAGYKLIVEVPEYGDTYREPLYIDFDGRKILIDTFEYVSGKWTLIDEFQIGKYFDAVSFKNDNTFTVGFGTDRFNSVSGNFHHLDLTTLEWSTQVADIPSESSPTRTSGSFFSSSGYFGSGSTNITYISETEVEYTLSDEFWRYENGNFINLGQVTEPRHYGVAFELNGALFLAGGLNSSGIPLRLFHKYDGSWSQMNALPFSFDSRYPHVSYNGREIFITPMDEVVIFEPSKEEFKTIGTLPFSVLTNGTLLSNGKELHVGLFFRRSTFYRMEIYLDQNNEEKLRMVRKNDFPGDHYMITVGSFEHNDDLYFLRAKSGSDTTRVMEFWRLEPNELN